MVKKDIIQRSFIFGVEVVKLSQTFPRNAAGFALSSQIVRSSTSIGANIEEAQDGLSKKDFIHSMNIALKEARETYYWLRIAVESGFVSDLYKEKLLSENLELVKILTSIVKNAKLSI